jgi:hypothetical protein
MRYEHAGKNAEEHSDQYLKPQRAERETRRGPGRGSIEWRGVVLRKARSARVKDLRKRTAQFRSGFEQGSNHG